jgi:hypothetical protein
MKPKSEPPGTKRLKLRCDILLSTSAFKFSLRRYSTEFKSGEARTKEAVAAAVDSAVAEEAAARATAMGLLSSAVDAEAWGALTPCTRRTSNIHLLPRKIPGV